MGEHKSQRTGKEKNPKKKGRRTNPHPSPLPSAGYAPLSLLSLSYLVPRPHYSASAFWVTWSERAGRLGYVTENALTEKVWEDATQGQGKSLSFISSILYSLCFLTGIRKMEDTSEKRSVSGMPKNYLNLPQNWNANINTSLMVRPVVYCGVKQCYALYHLRLNLSCCKTGLSWAGKKCNINKLYWQK